MPKNLLRPQDVIDDRWLVLQLLDSGGFSFVFEAEDMETGEKCVLKVESVSKKAETTTKMEVAVLLKLRGVSRHVCGILGCGRRRGRFHFLAMTFVGPTLADLRRQLSSGRMESGTVLRLGIQCVQAVQDVHEVGFLHRDVKPANFAIGRSETDNKTVYVLDFGLARCYLRSDNNGTDDIRPRRESAGFRGTLRYSSVVAHFNGELGRQDDLWSLMYSLIELRTGALPWHHVDDQSAMARMKCSMDIEQMVDTQEDVEIFEPITRELKQLRYDHAPNYEWFKQHLASVQSRFGYAIEGPFEWEEADDEQD